MARALLALAVAVLGCGQDDNGAEWREAFDAEPIGWFLSTSGTAERSFAVGGEPDSGLVYTGSRNEWSELEIGFEVPLLNWVHTFSANNVVAVGREGTILQYDGSTWTMQTSPTIEDLWGVWGAAPDDVWAVGGRGREEGQATLLHYDGQTWTEEVIPPLMRARVNALFKVWGTSANNVYVVGQRGAVLHYDGQAWTEELVGASDDLISLWGTGPDDITAVGGRASGIISHWNGSEWRTENLAPLPGLNGVWTQTAGVVHAVGAIGTLIKFDTTSFEFEQTFASTDLDFHAVFGIDGALTAVGGNILSIEPPFRGTAFFRDLGDDE